MSGKIAIVLVTYLSLACILLDTYLLYICTSYFGQLFIIQHLHRKNLAITNENMTYLIIFILFYDLSIFYFQLFVGLLLLLLLLSI